jgi:replicative DNA helicase
MGLDEAILAQVVRNPSTFTELVAAGVTEDDFIEENKKVWRYVSRIKREHDRIPSADQLLHRFDWIELPKTRKRDLTIQLADLKRRTEHNQLVHILREAADLLGDPDDINEAKEFILHQVNGLSVRNGKSAIRDLFSPDVRKEMVAELRRRKSIETVGIPTGLHKFDTICGGMMKGRFITTLARTGKGKAQPLSAKVLTPSGWKKIGDLNVGSTVCCPDGSTALVQKVFPQGRKPIYRLTFSDGAKTRATAEHLWKTQTRNERRRGEWSTKTTREIAASLKHGSYWNHYVPLIDPIDQASPLLPVDPYVVGVLLGDGHIRTRRGTTEILLSSADQELIDRVNDLLPEGATFQKRTQYDYRLIDTNGRPWHSSPLRQSIVEMGMGSGLAHEKRIPKIYMQGSAKDRLAVLQGLLDTDGSPANRTSAEYCSSSKKMAAQVRRLVWSLGGVATWSVKKTTHKDAYRLYVTLPEGTEYFRLSRKQNRIVPGQKLGRAVRTVRKVELIGHEEAQCVLIDHPDHLYITDNYVVTHNTWINLLFAREAVIAGGTVMLFPLEMTLFETAARLYTLFSARTQKDRVLKNLDLQSGNVSIKKVVRFLNFLEDHYAGQLYIADVGSIMDPMTVDRIRSEFELHKSVDVGWIDYIQLMRSTANRDARGDERIKELSNGCKAMAQNFDIVMGCSAQANREATRGGFLLPTADHVGLGDSIGQDSDQIISLAQKGKYLFYGVTKNRHGPQIGKTRLKFFPDEGLITEARDEDQDEEES